MTDTPGTAEPAETPRPRIFVIQLVGEDGRYSYTIAEEVAHIGPPKGEGQELSSALEDALRESLERLFRHEIADTARVLPFPAARDPAGGWQMFDSVRGPGWPPRP